MSGEDVFCCTVVLISSIARPIDQCIRKIKTHPIANFIFSGCQQDGIRNKNGPWNISSDVRSNIQATRDDRMGMIFELTNCIDNFYFIAGIHDVALFSVTESYLDLSTSSLPIINKCLTLVEKNIYDNLTLFFTV